VIQVHLVIIILTWSDNLFHVSFLVNLDFIFLLVDFSLILNVHAFTSQVYPEIGQLAILIGNWCLKKKNYMVVTLMSRNLLRPQPVRVFFLKLSRFTSAFFFNLFFRKDSTAFYSGLWTFMSGIELLKYFDYLLFCSQTKVGWWIITCREWLINILFTSCWTSFALWRTNVWMIPEP
jgi:hypothetical protein